MPDGKLYFVRTQSMRPIEIFVIAHIPIFFIAGVTVLSKDGFAVPFNFNTRSQKQFEHSVGIAVTIFMCWLHVVEQFEQIFLNDLESANVLLGRCCEPRIFNVARSSWVALPGFKLTTRSLVW